MYSGVVWRADSSSDRDVKTFARLAMREKLISLDSCVKTLNTDCVFLHFMQYLTEIRIKKFRQARVSFNYCS